MNAESLPGDRRTDQGRHAAPWTNLSPSRADVRDLIERADEHSLGRDFLLEGAQDSVAATFGVHAFVVDAARAHLTRSDD